MCHSRKSNGKINRLYEKCLNLEYDDKILSIQQLLEKGGPVSIHSQNFQPFETEMFKICKSSHSITEWYFPRKNDFLYSLRLKFHCTSSKDNIQCM